MEYNKLVKRLNMAQKEKLKNTSSENKGGFPIPVGSYKMILIGFGIVVLGFILMMGGGSDDPNVFPADYIGSYCGFEWLGFCGLGHYAEAGKKMNRKAGSWTEAALLDYNRL